MGIISNQIASQVKAMKVYTTDPLADSRWEDLVASHPKASPFHQRGWLEALARSYRYTPVVFTTSPPETALRNGIVFCHVNSWLTGNRLVSLPFSDHCEPICDSSDEMKALVRHAQAEMKQRGWRYLEIRPVDQAWGQASAEIGFQPGDSFYLHIIDLQPSLHDILGSFDKDSVRRRIHRADKAGLIERRGISEELLRDFYRMFVRTRRRHHVPPPPYVWFRNLIRCDRKAVEVRVAYKDRTPIAAILTLRFKGTGYFKYGCSDTRFNKFGATPWLLWRAIADAKSNGAVEFDLGRTEVDNPGLLAFKNHWVPRPKQLVYWRFPGTPSLATAGGRKLKIVQSVFSRMPDRVLAVAGKFIYRHIG
jgi:hypothetical protein